MLVPRMSKTTTNLKQLKLLANTIRQDIITMLFEAKSGHPAGALGMADVFTALYFAILKHDPKNPEWPERDRFVLSNGHICTVLYATLAAAGYFPKQELLTLRKLGSRLQGHPHLGSLPGIENSSGPLGQGLSQAVGIAIVAKREQKKWKTYCVVSDGEHNEGQIWEAVLLAAKYKLDNLIVIMDRNKIQIDGNTEDICPIEPLKEKYLAFGWYVIEANGNDINEVIEAYKKAQGIVGKPIIIIAHTVPGKGVSFTENRIEWHGKAPKKEEADKALAELEKQRKEI